MYLSSENVKNLSYILVIHAYLIIIRSLARQLHPDKHDPEETGMTSEEAVELFKLVNNAQEHLREIIRS